MDTLHQYHEMKNSKRVQFDFWTEKFSGTQSGYWAERILAEIGYLLNIYEAKREPIPALLAKATEVLYSGWQEDGVITRSRAMEAEEALLPLGKTAKDYELLFAAHAHIDMNWQWGMQETVNITVDTFQTMLDLMREYPDFLFSQSQASTYKIIEKYCPSMLPEIRERVKEGRWEVTASTWVEPDKNMSGGEAQARHILYTKRYLSELLDINPDSLELDFEPDTFGHCAFVPEIAGQGGIQYYYQCRGYEEEEAYRWRAPSGSELLVFRDRNWYGGPVSYDSVLFVPDFCTKYGTEKALRVYGVGDHGGGPTRRDIERIRDMATWPLMPAIRFSHLIDFYKELERVRETLPVVDHELNYVFTGCYTTQARVKLANRLCEDRLYDSEALCAMAELCGGEKHHNGGFQKAWERVLFNQFHDILPGSGVPETQDYALGSAQEALSYVQANANRALKVLGDAADTSAFGTAVDPESTSEGAGTGYLSMRVPNNAAVFPDGWSFTQTGRGSGDIRAFTIINTTQYERRETVELTVWDWNRSLRETEIVDAGGKELTFDVLEEDRSYWLHRYTRLAVTVTVPMFGFATIYVRHTTAHVTAVPDKVVQPRVHRWADGEVVLENQQIRAVFDSVTMKLVSLTEKKSGREIVTSGRPAGYFRYIREDSGYGMPAWVIGAYTIVEDLNETAEVHISGRKLDGVRKSITYTMRFRSSSLKVTVSLDEDSPLLRYSVHLDWHEVGSADTAIPQLQFFAPYAYGADKIRYDVPGGYVDRGEFGHDVPAILYASPIPKEGGSAFLMTTDSKYGYRADGGALSVTLVRSSFEPDLYPDQGVHQWELGLGAMESADWKILTGAAVRFSHPLYPYSNSLHTGKYGSTHSFLQVDGGVRVAAVKRSEQDSDELILRLSTGEESADVSIRTEISAAAARLTDITESASVSAEVEDGAVKTQLPPFSLRTVGLRRSGK